MILAKNAIGARSRVVRSFVVDPLPAGDTRGTKSFLKRAQIF